MAEAQTKQRILELVRRLPEDAIFEDAIERLCFLAKIESGLYQADSSRTIPHDEAKRRLLK